VREAGALGFKVNLSISTDKAIKLVPTVECFLIQALYWVRLSCVHIFSSKKMPDCPSLAAYLPNLMRFAVSVQLGEGAERGVFSNQ